jgi:DNA-binding NarL/FixJ family response regulator
MCAGLLDHAITQSNEREYPDSRARIVIADDNEPLLSSVAALLTGDFDVVGAVSNGHELLELIDRLHPDLIVCDITMPDVDGLEAARRLRDAGTTAKIVFLTVHDDSDYLREGLSVGAMGYVIKDKLVADLPKALHEALAGRHFVSASPNLQP